MSVSILEHLRDLQTRLRRLTWLSGLSSVLVFLLPALWLAGGLDWLMHFDDPGVRIILAVLIVGTAGWLIRQKLLQPLRNLHGEIPLALQIERRFPEFRDSLASAAQFQQDGANPQLGSPELQQDLITRTSTQLSQVGPSDVMNVATVRRKMFLALVTLGVTLLLLACFHQESVLAMTRLAAPFGNHPWPKQTALRLVDSKLQPLVVDPTKPLRLVEGSTFQFYIINLNRGGELPRLLSVELMQAGRAPISEPVARTTITVPGQNQREVGDFKLTVKEPLQLRAVGGDDNEMPWLQVETVPPPAVEQFQIEITPPGYLRLPAQKLPPGSGQIQGVVGSKVKLQGTANRPLQSASLVINDKVRHPAKLSADGKTLQAEMLLSEAGTFPWWWDVKDREGFTHPTPPKFELQVVADKVPEVRIELPASDLQVTATAEIPIRGAAKDDWGLSAVELHSRLQTEDQQKPAETVKIPLKISGELPRESGVETVLKLADLKLNAGQQLQLYLEARDAFDGTPPHVAKSVVRTITIISAEQKRRELSDIQAGLLTELERAAKSQSEARTQVRELQQQWEKAGQFRPQDRDLLQRTEMQQRQLQSELTSPSSGVLPRAKDLLRQYRDNGLNDKETEAQLNRLTEELQDLSKEPFPLIEDALMRARKELADRGNPTGKNSPSTESPKENTKPAEQKKSTDQKAESTPAGKEEPAKSKEAGAGAKQEKVASTSPNKEGPLNEAAEQQGMVRERLQGLIQEMTQWRDQRYAARQIEELIGNQEQIRKETSDLGQKTLGKGTMNLTPQEKADLSRIGERQQNLAERLDQLQKQLTKTVERPQGGEQKQPAEEREEIKDFLEQAEKQGTAPLMQNAARDVAANNLGQAGKTQQDVLKQLKELDDLLRNRTETDTGNLVKRLQQAQEELEKLQQKQQELLTQNEKSQAESDAQKRKAASKRQADQQQQLRQSSEQLSRRMRRLQSESARQELQQATNRMNQAEKSLQQESGSTAQEQQKTASAHLDEARKQLEQDRRDAEQQLAREKLREVQEQWKDLIARQQKALDQTTTLHKAQQEKGQWNRVQLRNLGDLTKRQKELEQVCSETGKQLAGAEILALALKRATQSMHAAGDLLQERQAGPITQRAQRMARDRLQQVLDSFQNDPQQKTAGQEEQPQGEGEQGNPPQDQQADQQLKISLADLKVVRSLQQELNQRTDELTKELAARKSDPSPAVKQEMQRIASEQGELLQTLQKLIQNATKKKAPSKNQKPAAAPMSPSDVVPPPLPQPVEEKS